ncbi:MAG: DUF5011 domain-containing protein [Ruminococcaceae bacterium]|nr:DUF5011 domain-containing protein [Oscillospiraceae bacterium]
MSYQNDYRDEVTEYAKRRTKQRVKRKVRSKAKRTAKSIHALSYVIWVLALAVGVFAGILASKLMTANDEFRVIGSKEYVLYVGDENRYFRDQGVSVIDYGRDYSDKVTVSSNIEQEADGAYRIDTTKPGRYYIEYRVNSPRYKNVSRIRTFTVLEREANE